MKCIVPSFSQQSCESRRQRAILAVRTGYKPSVIQFRGPGSRRPEPLAQAILSNLTQISEALASGSIVTFEPSRLRVRALPIGGPSNKG